MATEPPSRTSGPATLAGVLEAIDTHADLEDWQRRDLSWAIRTLCRTLGQAPADVAADPEVLGHRMHELTAAAAGVSRGGWRNVKTLSKKALVVAGVTTTPGRGKAGLMPEWKDLLDRIVDPEQACQKYRLSRLVRYCSGRGLSPAAVDDGVMAAFAGALGKSLLSRPKQRHRSACLAWNHCMENVPGWPQTQVVVPNNRRDYSLDLSAFPESYRAEVEAYLTHLAGDDLLADTAANPASSVTIRFRRLQLRQMASALVRSGRKRESICGLKDLVAVEAATAILIFFRTRSGKRKSGQIHNFALLLVNIARHWVGEIGPEHLEQLQKLRRNVDPGKKGLTDKSRSRLLPFEDEQNMTKLACLPQQIDDDVRRHDRGGVAEALKMLIAVAIAIELVAPLRAKNLARLDLKRHIRRTRPGPGGKVYLVIPAHEVKNKVPLEFELPADVVPILDRYIEVFRPRLVDGPNPWLFPAKSGGPRPPGPLGVQISQTIRKMTGLVMNLHLFRHLAAQIILAANPGAYEQVRLLLGHQSGVTTTTYYCGSEQKAAFKYYDSIVSKFRKPDGGGHGRK